MEDAAPPQTHLQDTLGYYYIRKEVEKMLTFTTEAMLDKEEIEEDLEAPPAVLDVD